MRRALFGAATRLYRRLFPVTAGSWLFRQEVVAWLYRRDLRKQLPAMLTLFSTYCGVQRLLVRSGPILGAETLLRWLIAVRSTAGAGNPLRLRVGARTIFLDPSDPRMLQVPNELIGHDGPQAVLPLLLEEGDTFVDVGANHGTFSLLAAEIVGRRGLVVAVEPQPNLNRLVQRTLDENGRSPHQVISAACGQANESAHLYVARRNSGASGLFRRNAAAGAASGLPVELRRLDDLIDWRTCPGSIVMKLDVEGSELSAIRGARKLLEARRPRILMEINPRAMAGAGWTAEELADELRALGYLEFWEVGHRDRLRKLHELSRLGFSNVVVQAG